MASAEEELEREMEAVPNIRQVLIAGHNLPTEAEGDPHDRIDYLETVVLSLYDAILLAGIQIDDLRERLPAK